MCIDCRSYASLIDNVFQSFGMQRARREPGGSTKELAIKIKNEPVDSGSEIQKTPVKRKRKSVESKHN
jgi:hypothetical protein